MTGGELQFLEVGRGAAARRIAMRIAPGGAPAVVWLGGFRSDMDATKATVLAAWAEGVGRAAVRFDYSGHGASGGRFEEGTIGRWAEDAEAVVNAHGGEAPVLVGSSMGGWIALLVARARLAAGRPVGGLVLVAPAPDFTEALMWRQEFTDDIRREIMETGFWMRHSDYAPEPYPITRALIEDGRDHLVLEAPLRVGCPVTILQGMEDPDVPWSHALTLVEHLAGDDVTLTLVKDGDHRLSRPEDLERLVKAVAGITAEP